MKKLNSSFGVVEDHLSPRANVIYRHHKQSDIATQHAQQRLFCFYILHFNSFISFQAIKNIWEIIKYFGVYVIFNFAV